MLKIMTLVSSLSLLAGCLYKIDVQQGNVLEDKYVSQLKQGLSKNQVVALIGSPQLKDPFHTQRWDYFSSSKTNNRREHAQTNLTLIFEGDRLVEIIK